MKQILKYPLVLLFSLFILGFSAVDVLKPDKYFSPMENIILAQRPDFTITTLFDNSYSQNYEKYINQQFVGRDIWISMKSVSETALGKIENNGIVYGDKDYMFEKYKAITEKQFAKNKEYVAEFIAMYPDLPITFTIIPSSYMILEDYLPDGLNNVNQKQLTEDFYNTLTAPNLKKVSFYDALSLEKEKYIYYRTDHHWTTYGAYIAYAEYIQSLGKTPLDIYALKSNEVENFYGTYFSKAKLYSTVPDTMTYYDIPVKEMVIDGKTVTGLYDTAKFDERDKYGAYLHGNNGLTVIKSDVNADTVEGETSKLLVIKDSFANSFVPYLLYHFDEIYVVDLRYFRSGLSKLIPEHEFEDVLLMYNFMNFESDANIAQLRY